MKTISRRRFFRHLAGILSYGVYSGCFYEKQDRPNIVFITMDATRYDRMGFNGYRARTREGTLESTTPYLDSVAARGVAFDRNYCQAHITQPSISSLFNSGYYEDNGLGLHTEGGRERATLAEILKREGYQTYGAVSTSLLSKKIGMGRGFDVYLESDSAKRRGDRTIDILLETLSGANINKPLFIYYHTYDPHTPHDAPDEFKSKFHSPGKFDDSKKTILGYFEGLGQPGGITEKQCKELSDEYDGQILYADKNIQNLMINLKKRGLFEWERDLFILTADHGESLGESRHCCFHNGLGEEIIRTPLLFAGGGFPKNKRVNSLSMNVDVVPTILSRIGGKIPENCRGTDLSGALNGDRNIVHTFAYSQSLFRDALAVVGNGGMKYIHRVLPETRREVQAREGFSPGGRVDFSGKDRFKLVWPGEIIQDRNSLVWIEMKRDGDGEAFFNCSFLRAYDTQGICVEKEGIPARDESDKLIYGKDFISKMIDSTFFGEDFWNAAVVADVLFRWEIRNGNLKEEVEFGLNPSPNFNKLCDLRQDPFGRGNFINDPSYSSHLRLLEKVAREFLRDKNTSREVISPDLTEKEKEDLRTLGYL